MRRLLTPLRELWKDFLDLLFPPPRGCPLCGAVAREGELCSGCREAFLDNRMPVGCHICGCFQRTSGVEAGVPCSVSAGRLTGRGAGPPLLPYLSCPHCGEARPPFKAARAVGPYEGVLKEAVLRLKFRRERGLARPLGRLLAVVARELVPGGVSPLVVPVPVSGKRLQTRGFNQAEWLARELAMTAGWVLVPALRKVRETAPQTGLSRADRLKNLSGCFAAAPDVLLAGRVVLLVDDVFTTGSTARECAGTLLAAGAAAVYVVTVAAPFCSRGSTGIVPGKAEM